MAITRYNLEAKPDEIKKPLAEFHTLSTRGSEGVDDFEFSQVGFPETSFSHLWEIFICNIAKWDQGSLVVGG